MKILLVQTGFIGDVILTTPVIENLKQLFPDSEITFFTTPIAEPLVRHHPQVARTIVFDKRGSDSGVGGMLRTAEKLRSHQFDLAVSLHKSWRTSFLLHRAGIPERVGFYEARARFLYSRTARRADLPHEVLRNLAILRNFGHEPETLRQDLQVGLTPEVEARAESLLTPIASKTPEGRLIGLAPGSVWKTKRWPVEYFAEIARKFIEKGNSVVVLGAAADQSLGQAIQKQGGEKILNLTGKTSLLESAAVISRLHLFITNDSAPLHLASAFHTPVIAIFCATVPEFGFGPWQTPSIILGLAGLYCRPCGRHGSQSCPTGTELCQRGVLPNAVLQAADSLLAYRKMETQVEQGGL